MEGLFLILVGAALVAQSWQLLGLYSDGRTMGVVVGGLGVLILGTFMLGSAVEPILLTEVGKKASTVAAGDVAVSTALLTTLAAVWAVYAIGVGAHGLWDLDDRALGFHSAIVAVVSLGAFLYFAGELDARYGENVMLAMSAAALVLTGLATILFFYLAFGFNVLKLVSGWFLLIGGAVVSLIGLAVIVGVVAVTA
jgi:hypothetical protein